MDSKMEIKQEPCLLEKTFCKMKSESEMTPGSNVHIKSEPASFASDLAMPSDTYIQMDHKIVQECKIEIKEEPIYLEMSFSTLNSEPGGINLKDADSHPDIEDDTSGGNEFVLPQSPRFCSRLMGMTDRDTGTEVEVSWQKRMSTEMKVDPEGHLPSDVYLKNEILPFCSEFIVESKNVDIKEMDSKTDLKQEFCLLQKTSGEIKPDSGVTHNSDVYIKSEPASFASDIAMPSDSHIHSNHKIDTKIEIKEEPVYLEMTPSKDKFEPDKINLKHVDLHSDAEDNTSEGDEEFILPEPSRLDAKSVWNCESDVTSAGLDKDCLKLRENLGPFHDKDKSNEAHGCSITGIFHVNDKMSHKCEICEKRFNLASELEIHILVHEEKKLYKCKVCDKNFNYASRLRVHYLIHENTRPFKCDKCDNSFTWAQNLKTHNLIHEGKRPFKCNMCDKSFTRSEHLKRHNLIHDGKRPFKCDVCDKSFTRSEHLKTHHLNHEGKRLFKCEKCDKSFTQSKYLRIHNLIHDGKSPYKCHLCDKSFTRSTHLKIHNLIHEGKRPFKCDVCDKSFSRSKYLKTHKLVHEGERIFKCGMCDKSFTRSKYLKTHNLIHEGKRLFKCNMCDKSFTRSEHLKMHNLIHEGRKPFKCDVCDKSFTQSQNLKRHIVIHAGKPV